MNTWLYTIIVLILTYLIFKIVQIKRRFKKWGIPNPPEIPFLGILGQNLGARKHMSEILKEQYITNKAAKYYGCHMFLNPAIVVQDLDLIKSILVKDFDHFANRAVLVDENTDPLFGKNLASLNGKRWKEGRGILSPSFTASKMRGMYVLMARCSNNFVNTFIDKFGDKEEIDTKDAFTRYANDVIASCAFGLEIDSLKEPDNEFYLHGRHSVKDLNRMTLSMFLLVAFPFLGKKLGFTITPKEDAKYFVNLIGNTMRMRREKGIQRPDVIQLLMDAEVSTKDFDILNVTAQSFSFFLGGFETSSIQMCWMAHELAVNPEIQRKLQEEIDAVVEKSNGQPSYEAINNMTYLDALFSEILRIHAVPTLNRTCSKEFELPPALPGAKPFVVPRGFDIIIPAHTIHHDPQYYENPDELDPDRFLNKRSNTSDVTTLGFGLGPRMCIGSRFAIAEVKVLIFYLLAKCNLKPCSKTCIPCVYDKKSFTPIPEGGFWIKFEQRT